MLNLLFPAYLSSFGHVLLRAIQIYGLSGSLLGSKKVSQVKKLSKLSQILKFARSAQEACKYACGSSSKLKCNFLLAAFSPKMEFYWQVQASDRWFDMIFMILRINYDILTRIIKTQSGVSTSSETNFDPLPWSIQAF